MDRASGEIRRMAEFLRDVHGADGLRHLAMEVERFVRDALPARARDRRMLSNFGRSLEAALEQEALKGVASPEVAARADAPPPAGTLASGPGSVEAIIETGAALLDSTMGAALNGDILRLSTENIRDAAHAVAERSMTQRALQVCQELESAGAPASLLFSVHGRLLWRNGSLKHLLFRRELDEQLVQKEAQQLARLVLENYWRSGFAHGKPHEATRYFQDLNLNLSASLLGSPATPLETMVRVTASEARRRTLLSSRELEVAKLLAERESYKDVAARAGVSLDTVRTYVRRIYRKLALNSRFALRQRLVHDGLLQNSMGAQI